MKNCKFSFAFVIRTLLLQKQMFLKSLTDQILKTTRYQIMIKCWKNDPDARPTFIQLKKQLKDMETMHKVRIVNSMKVSIYARATGLGSAY